MAKDKKTSASTWKKRFELAADRQSPQFRKFASWYDLHYAHIDTSEYALWRSKVYLPLVPAKARAIVTKLTALNPGWEVGLYGENLNDPEAQLKAEKAQWKLEHDWDNPEFDESMSDKLTTCLVDAVVTGTGIAKAPWCFRDTVRFEKHMDEDTQELDFTKDDKIVSGRGYNDLIPHDIMSTFIAPGAKSLQDAEWVILEDYTTYSALTREQEASGDVMYDEKALKSVEGMKADSDQFSTEKASRDQTTDNEDAITADSTVSQIKRLECYEKSSGRIYIFAVGSAEGGKEDTYVELSSKLNPYWHGKYPLVPFYVEKRPYSFWGKGIYEDTERLQSAFNDMFNFLVDGINLSQAPMILKQEGEEYSYIIEPGGEFLYQNDKPEPFKFPEPNPVQFQNILNFIEAQVESTTISSYATGNPNSATDSTQGTATGIMKLQEAAGDKLSGMKKQFSGSLREIGRMWLSNNQQFLDQPINLMGQVDNMPAPVTIDPADLQGEMQLRINDASMEPATKEQQVVQLNDTIQQLISLQSASIQQSTLTQFQTKPLILDFASLAQDVLQARGQANFDKIIINPDEKQIQFAPPQDPNAQPEQQEDPAAEIDAKIQESQTPDYKSSPGYLKYQMEAKAGFDPDPSHLHETAENIIGQPEEELGQTEPSKAGSSGRPGQTV